MLPGAVPTTLDEPVEALSGKTLRTAFVKAATRYAAGKVFGGPPGLLDRPAALMKDARSVVMQVERRNEPVVHLLMDRRRGTASGCSGASARITGAVPCSLDLERPGVLHQELRREAVTALSQLPARCASCLVERQLGPRGEAARERWQVPHTSYGAVTAPRPTVPRGLRRLLPNRRCLSGPRPRRGRAVFSKSHRGRDGGPRHALRRPRHLVEADAVRLLAARALNPQRPGRAPTHRDRRARRDVAALRHVNGAGRS